MVQDTHQRKVSFAIAGCGSIGKRHASFIAENPEADLVGVFDIEFDRSSQMAKKYNCTQYNSYNELLQHSIVDIVSICTPSGLHAPMTIDAAMAKKHVICEKPMALCLEDAENMISSAESNNVNLFIVKQNRFNEPVAYLKKAVEAGKLGSIFMISSNVYWNRNNDYYSQEPWRGTWALDGGALLTQSSHFVDLMQWLGGCVISVYAKMGRYNHPKIETEDTGILMLKYASGVIGVLQYTTCTYPKNIEGSISVFGTTGSVKVGGGYLNQLDLWEVENTPRPEITEVLKPNNYGTYQGSASNHGKVIQNVIDVLKRSDNIMTDGKDGMKSVEIMVAAHISARTGKEIKIPLGEEYAKYRL